MTCSAYERDVSACLDYLQGQGIALAEVKVTHLRAFLADAIYVQAKKWAPDRTIGPREIREFLGALQDVEAAKGIFITTSNFSADAQELARRRRIVLMDGLDISTRMVEAGVGVTTLQTYELKRID